MSFPRIRALLLLAGFVFGFGVCLYSEEPSELTSALKVERGLLALDLLSLKEERARNEKARNAVNALYAKLDRAVGASTVTQGTFETLDVDLSAARSAERDSADRIARQLNRIQERLGRIGLLEGAARGSVRVPDPLSGRWLLRMRPPELSGFLELYLNGSIVSGSYHLEGGGSGSVRGTYSNGKLHLERIDSSAGFDTVFDGRLKSQNLDGTWSANDLAVGKPTSGEWSATKDREQ